jgi:uncharacterized membrane protein YfcA
VEEKIVIWLFFSVGIALVPIIYAGLHLYTNKKIHNARNAFKIVIARGDLLLVITALCGSSIGGLIASGESHKMLKIIFGGFSTLILILSSLYFSSVSENKANSTAHEDKGDDDVIFIIALLFCLAFISCAVCVLLT